MRTRLIPLLLLLAAAPAAVQADELRPFKPLSDGRLGEIAHQALANNRPTPDNSPYNEWSPEILRLTEPQNTALILDDLKKKLDAAECDFTVPEHSEWWSGGTFSLNVKSIEETGVGTCSISDAQITIAPFGWNGGPMLSIHHKKRSGRIQLIGDADYSNSLDFLLTHLGEEFRNQLEGFQRSVQASNSETLSTFSADVAAKFFEAALDSHTAGAIYYDYLLDIVQEAQSED